MNLNQLCKLQLRITICSLLILLGIHLNSEAQTSKNLSLQEAIQLSIKNSHKLAASDARIQQAVAKWQEAKENRLPEVSASGSLLWLNNPEFSLKTGKPGSDSSGKIPHINEAAYAMVNAGIPIFTGGKLKYGIESARYLQEAAVLDAARDTSAIIFNTIEAYTNLYKASVTVRVVRENLSQALHRDSVLLRLENNGLLARNDRLKAQLQSSNIEISLLEVQNNTKLAMINMNLLLGLPENTQLILDSTSFESIPNALTLAELEQYSVSNRQDVLALNQREKAANAGILAAKAEWYPQVSVTAGYIAAYIPHLLTLTNAINAGIGVKYNISSIWKTKTKVAAAKAQLKELQANEMQLQDAVKMQVNQSFEGYILQEKKMPVYQKAVAQAEENYRITKNKFDNELVNMTDLLDANLLLLQSHINLAVAKADLYLSYHKLLQTAGKLSL